MDYQVCHPDCDAPRSVQVVAAEECDPVSDGQKNVCRRPYPDLSDLSLSPLLEDVALEGEQTAKDERHRPARPDILRSREALLQKSEKGQFLTIDRAMVQERLAR